MLRNRQIRLAGVILVTALLALAVGAVVAGNILSLPEGGRQSVSPLGDRPVAEPVAQEADLVNASAQAQGRDPLILSYAAKFVCLEPLPAGQFWFGPAAPILSEHTDVLIHNPNDIPVTFYKKAVRAPFQDVNPIPPGEWDEFTLKPDYAVREDCDGIAKLLTGNPAATFAGTYGIGVKVEGFVVVAVGPQDVPGAPHLRHVPLDVVGEYTRGSEVLKKDINYQPWWWWWWWPLPWQLGYAYERIIPINPQVNIDCRQQLYAALHADVDRVELVNTQQISATHAALDAGMQMDPRHVGELSNEDPPALVAMIGGCRKLDATMASVDYALLSNKGPTDSDPTAPLIQPTDAQQVLVRYPWIPGRWYDLTVVVPQNLEVDLDDFQRRWLSDRWVAAGADLVEVRKAMRYYLPWSCGWGYWWGWWHGNDCIDIGVGEGESIDVEQITPVRVFKSKWPPVP